jgi:hypothetical protein
MASKTTFFVNAFDREEIIVSPYIKFYSNEVFWITLCTVCTTVPRRCLLPVKTYTLKNGKNDCSVEKTGESKTASLTVLEVAE